MRYKHEPNGTLFMKMMLTQLYTVEKKKHLAKSTKSIHVSCQGVLDSSQVILSFSKSAQVRSLYWKHFA